MNCPCGSQAVTEVEPRGVRIFVCSTCSRRWSLSACMFTKCGSYAEGQCSECGRYCCAKHLSTGRRTPLCDTCWRRARNLTARPARNVRGGKSWWNR